MALRAGMDNELPTTAAFGAPLRQAVDDGRVDVDLIDLAVERTLRLKFRLGLFDRPYVEPPTAVELAALDTVEQGLARDLAQRSMTLVENDGTLPLSPDLARIAVIGPIADSARDLLGDYAHLPHIETLAELRHQANPFGFPSSEVINPVDELSGMPTILGALRARFGERVVHARGSGLRDGTDEELAEAVALAQGADVAIVAVGERSGLTNDATTGESRDRRDLGLLGRQQELLEAVVATGTPTVLVVVSGRPLAIEWAAEHCAAVLLAWVPGEAGPAAIADILAGDVDPGGRLPVTIPRHVGQVPLTYRHHPTGGKSNWKIDYVDGTSSPLWPFGHGLSYTTFAIEHLRVDKSLLQTSGDTVAIQVEVTNTGTRTRRRGGPALRPRRGGDRGAARPRAARLPATAPGRRRVPNRHVPPVDRAAGVRRRRPATDRRARHGPAVRRPVGGRRVPRRGHRARRAGGRARRASRLRDRVDRRVAQPAMWSRRATR